MGKMNLAEQLRRSIDFRPGTKKRETKANIRLNLKAAGSEADAGLEGILGGRYESTDTDGVPVRTVRSARAWSEAGKRSSTGAR